MKILAIDPSLTNTAAVIGDPFGVLGSECFGSDPRTQSVYHRVLRYRTLVDAIRRWASWYSPDAVFIEGYAFGANMAMAKFAAEYGGLLRSMLIDLTSDVYEIAPHSLKKFAGGAGKGGKERVIAGLERQYGVSFKTDDEYDAFGLYRLGLCVLGLAKPIGLPQIEVTEQIRNPMPKVRKPRKRKARKAKEARLF